MPSSQYDQDWIAEIGYPLAMKKVILEAGRDPLRQKDVRISQSIVMTAGVGAMPTNIALECIETAVVNLNPVTMTDPTFPGSNRLSFAAHGYWTGLPVVWTDPTADIGTQLTSGTTYYAIYVSSSLIQLATSLANAFAGTAIVLGSAPASGYSVTPTYTRGSVSYVPNYFDYTGSQFSPLIYWTTKSGSFYMRPVGTTSLIMFAGTVPVEAVVFPAIVSNSIDIVSGTALAEDIVDSIVAELASLIRQEVPIAAVA